MRAPDSSCDGGTDGWWSGLRRRHGRRGLRPVRLDGVHDEVAGGLDRGWPDRPAALRLRCRALIASGHFSMAMPLLAMFYFGLVPVVMGTDLLKGNVGVIVGLLYKPRDGRREAGYSIFIHGHQHRVARGSARLRISRPVRELAGGPSGDWCGNGSRPVQYVGRKHLGDAGLHPADPARPKV